MIKILKDTIEYIGLGVFLLGLIIVYGTLRANGFNAYILGTGILLMAIPVIIYLIVEKTKDKPPKGKRPRDLKLTGIEIPVDLTKCIVKSNQWTSDEERYGDSRVVLLNEISGHSEKNVERVEINLSRIAYSCDFNGKRRTFLSPTIAKDKITVTLLLEMQKETIIYVDRDNDRHYYFDVEFID